MDRSVRTDPEKAPSRTDVEALYDELFGTPALDAVETNERDEFDAYATVYEVAKQFPAVARKAARDGSRSLRLLRGRDPHERGGGP